MSTALKLAGFAALLVLIFGVATVAGGAIGPDRTATAERRAQTGAHADGAAPRDDVGHGDGLAGEGEGDGDASQTAAVPDGEVSTGDGHEAAATPVRGLALSEGGLKLALRRTELARGSAGLLRFAIRDGSGEAVRDFEGAVGRRMHLIVVRRDGRGFQHLHGTLDANGLWRTRLKLSQPGAYRVFADFRRDGRAYTLAGDLAVDGPADYRPLPVPANVAATDGYEVELEPRGSALRFAISLAGQPVRTQRYLGAAAHLVALREGDLAFLHVHPVGAGVAFEIGFPSTGRYRLYLEFKHADRIHTAEFTRLVTL